MIKVEDKLKYCQLFQEYTHNIPVIYSSLEGQYDGEVFVDSEIDTQIAILFTPFAFHFVAGNHEIENVVDVLDEAIFHQYLGKTGQKEAIVFCPNQKWDNVLDEVFSRHHGMKDGRKVFHLNRDRFKEVEATGRMDLQGLMIKLLYEKVNRARVEYPMCRIMNGEECISFCSGFMLGKGHAEIDVSTEEPFRRKGYAKETSISLISELLRKGIEPDWCTWPYRVESERLALSLGYELFNIVPAHIWVEEECGI